ncbi:hypothetical protein BDR26DRAFT_862074 [Obelidium mucronatum]|nr:hypothetical protein BDR26DRAFT_862074 [Obelidium mucronatum]
MLSLPSPPLSPPPSHGQTTVRGIRRPPSVEFEHSGDEGAAAGVECESPVLQHPHMAVAPPLASSGADAAPTNAEAEAPAPAHAAAPAGASANASVVGLPHTLVESPALAAQFRVCLGVRIQTLRLLVLDVDGAPVVPLDHLRLRMQMGRGRRLTRDYAAETAAALLERLEAANADADADAAEPRESDDASVFQDAAAPPCVRCEAASELGRASALRPFRSPLSCDCDLCNSASLFNQYLAPPLPADLSALEQLDWVLHQQKMDYHKPHMRRLAVFEDRLGLGHDGVCVCQQHGEESETENDRDPQNHQHQEDEQSEIDDDEDEEDEDDEEEDYTESNETSDDSDDSSSHLDSDQESEEDLEESFLDDYMAKLHELFGLLEVNAKLEEILHICR